MNLAIFGGTFDPIHTAHLEAARAASAALELDRVLFIPAAVSPFKAGITTTPFEHRLRMVQLAIAGEPGFEASDIEAGTARSYSIDTVEKLEQGPANGARLFFIIGADAFAEIRGWHRWQDLTAKVEFIVVSRPGHEYEIPPGVRVHRLDSLSLNVSSTQARRDIATTGWAPHLQADVLAYINEHGLYASRS